MSNAAMSAVFRLSRSKGGARLVLLAMADEANDEGYLTAYKRSQSWLAAKANVDGGTARRAIQTLVQLGEVEVISKGDGRVSSDYRIVLPGLNEGVQNAPPQDEGRQDAPPGGAERAPRGGETRAQGVQDAPPIIPFSPGDVPISPVSVEGEQPQLALTDVPPDGGSFDAWWALYPKRNGKRVGRSQAAGQWRRLKPPDRAAARRAVDHYRAACDAGLTIAKDAHRWLRDRAFDDWLEPATDVRSGPGAQPTAPDPAARTRGLAVTLARTDCTEDEAMSQAPRDLADRAAFREAFHGERSRLETRSSA